MIRLACLVLLVMSAADVPDAADLKPVPVPGIERVLRVDDQLLVGSAPTPAAYRALRELGVQVVLSVDGMPPDLELIRSLGLRSVHLPIEYGGIEPGRIRSLVRLLGERPGSIYVHCHHGRHRAPAVAAILWMLRTGAVPESARRILEQAGTSPTYPGLWEAVRTHVAPSGACGDALLPERVEVAGVAASMVAIDRLRDRLDGWADRRPDASGAEAVLVLEHLRELHRLDPAGHAGDPGWVTDLDASITAAEALAEVTGGRRSSLSRHELLDRLDASCIGCHARHRD